MNDFDRFQAELRALLKRYDAELWIDGKNKLYNDCEEIHVAGYGPESKKYFCGAFGRWIHEDTEGKCIQN